MHERETESKAGQCTDRHKVSTIGQFWSTAACCEVLEGDDYEPHREVTRRPDLCIKHLLIQCRIEEILPQYSITHSILIHSRIRRQYCNTTVASSGRIRLTVEFQNNTFGSRLPEQYSYH